MNVKQYLADIKGFFNSHGMLNTASSGNQFNFNCDSKIVYPVGHVEYIDQRTTDGEITFNFLITIADIFDHNQLSSEEDIYSDTAEIANDVISHYDNQIGVDYILETSAQIQKFNNGLKDGVCGATFLLSFTETRLSNACIIPQK